MNRRAGLGNALRLAFVAPAVLAVALPGEASASSAKNARRPVPAPRLVQPVSWLGPSNVPTPQGTERMISDSVRLQGTRGDGAGPVRVELDGAQPNSVYEVAFVPNYDPGAVLTLGSVRTDARGAFHGAAPQPVPPLLEIQRTGMLVIRRLPFAQA